MGPHTGPRPVPSPEGLGRDKRIETRSRIAGRIPPQLSANCNSTTSSRQAPMMRKKRSRRSVRRLNRILSESEEHLLKVPAIRQEAPQLIELTHIQDDPGFSWHSPPAAAQLCERPPTAETFSSCCPDVLRRKITKPPDDGRRIGDTRQPVVQILQDRRRRGTPLRASPGRSGWTRRMTVNGCIISCDSMALSVPTRPGARPGSSFRDRSPAPGGRSAIHGCPGRRPAPRVTLPAPCPSTAPRSYCYQRNSRPT